MSAPSAPRERDLLSFFWPLAATQIAMGFAHVIITGAIGRTPDSTTALAALAVAGSVSRVAEAPFLMSRQFGVTYGTSREGLRVALAALAVLLLPVMLIQALIVYGPLSDLVLGRLLGAGPDLMPLAQTALQVSMWVAALTAVRHLLQGFLSRHKRTASFAVGIALRLALTFVLGLALVRLGVAGSLIGAILLTAGIGAEAVVAFVNALRLLRGNAVRAQSAAAAEAAASAGRQQPVSFMRGLRSALAFFLPLGISALVAASTRSFIDAGLARTADAAVALAGYSAVYTVSAVFFAAMMMIHQLVIVFGASRAVRRFTLLVAGVASGLMALATWTPLEHLLLQTWLGVPAPVAVAARPGLRLLCLLPLLVAAGDYYAGVLLSRGRSGAVARGRLANVAVSVPAALLVIPPAQTTAGAVLLASGCFALGYGVEAFVNWQETRRRSQDWAAAGL